MNLDKCINLDDLRHAAKRRVPKVIFGFIEGGIDDEGGLTRNSNAFENRSLVPRYMTGVDKEDQRASVFGREYYRSPTLHWTHSVLISWRGIRKYSRATG